MGQPVKKAIVASAVGVVFGVVALANTATAQEKAEMSAAAKGKQVSENRKKGNCLACHVMGDGASPDNIGPPVVAMKARFPDKAKLREQIWDAANKNPNSMMPPFGRHGVLTEKEVDAVVEYVYTLWNTRACSREELKLS